MALPYVLGEATSSTGSMSGLEDLRRLASRYPNPTNAQAVAALDAIWQADTAESAIAAGWREDVASAFLPPDGIFPRMRLLAWGWTKPGDKFKSPSDAKWWRSRYQYPLWNPIETWLDQALRGGHVDSFVWEDDLAAGDPAELSRSLPAVVRDDLPPVSEAPCPKWLIPPGRGMMPIANPECLRKPAKDIIDKLRPQPTSPPGGLPWLWLLAFMALVTASKEKRR